jgi:hypothetical protein
MCILRELILTAIRIRTLSLLSIPFCVIWIALGYI